MRQVTRLTIIAGVAMLLAGPARADATLFGARVGAQDAPALAEFYESVFGLKEIERIEFPNFLEILMNFGDSVEAAKANPGPRVIVMKRASDNLDDPIPHLALNVTDMKATMTAVKAAGGSFQGEPHEFGKTGILILFGVDPAGNKFEMIQPPK
jgi:predicted enzyme related to lactoylglutathione lyase